jgi:hypothetical protein
MACAIKLFTHTCSILHQSKLECLSQSIKNLGNRLEPTQVEPLMELNCKYRFIVLPVNIRLSWKWLKGANTLAYYEKGFITVVKVLQNRSREMMLWNFPSSAFKIFLFLKSYDSLSGATSFHQRDIWPTHIFNYWSMRLGRGADSKFNKT